MTDLQDSEAAGLRGHRPMPIRVPSGAVEPAVQINCEPSVIARASDTTGGPRLGTMGKLPTVQRLTSSVAQSSAQLTQPEKSAARPPPEEEDHSLVQEMKAEALGTAFVVFFGVASVVAGNSLTAISFTFGFVVYVMAESFGDVSGAHFNPAVSLMLCLVGGLPVRRVFAYWASQFVGAFAGAALLFAMTPDDANGSSLYVSGLHIPEELSIGQAFLWEFVTTLALVRHCGEG